jgi:hypothetical protein
VGKGGPLIVAEGYMDVIALVTAGFEAAVAPLGTAITEDQLRMIWRLSPEPVIALDGDTRGPARGLSADGSGAAAFERRTIAAVLPAARQNGSR